MTNIGIDAKPLIRARESSLALGVAFISRTVTNTSSVPLLVMVIEILSPAIAAAPLKQSSAPTSVTTNLCNRFIGTVYPLSCKLHDTAPLAAGSLARIELRRALWHDA